MRNKFERKRHLLSTLCTCGWTNVIAGRGGRFRGEKMHVSKIRPTEQIVVDHAQLATLYQQMGDVSAEEVVCRALEELALRLAECGALYEQQDWLPLRKIARSLGPVADQIGMTQLSGIARSVADSIDQADPTALAATLSRLVRVGEQSLTQVWNAHEQLI